MTTHTSTRDPFGPYRPSIESLAASCEDYLRRVRLGMSDSRHYTIDKATCLRDTAARLARAAYEAGWGLRCCDGLARAVDLEGKAFLTDCALPAGHAGPHADYVPASPLAKADQAAHDLAEAARDLADTLAWIRHRGDVVEAEDLEDVRSALGEVRRGLARASAAVEQLAPVVPAGEEE